jgi:homoserine kinase
MDKYTQPHRLSDLDHIDELNKMKLRLHALETALCGAGSFDKGDERDGILQLVSDLAERMKACAEDFEAERKLRIEEELARKRRLGKDRRFYPVIVNP